MIIAIWFVSLGMKKIILLALTAIFIASCVSLNFDYNGYENYIVTGEEKIEGATPTELQNRLDYYIHKYNDNVNAEKITRIHDVENKKALFVQQSGAFFIIEANNKDIAANGIMKYDLDIELKNNSYIYSFNNLYWIPNSTNLIIPFGAKFIAEGSQLETMQKFQTKLFEYFKQTQVQSLIDEMKKPYLHTKF